VNEIHIGITLLKWITHKMVRLTWVSSNMRVQC